MASRDRGIEAEDGSRIDSAEEVMEELEESTDIGWKVLDDPEKALQGVRSGKYYAAVIFEDGFTYEMHHFQEAVEDGAIRADIPMDTLFRLILGPLRLLIKQWGLSGGSFDLCAKRDEMLSLMKELFASNI